MPSDLAHLAWIGAAPAALWCLFLGLSTSSYFQRLVLYSHWVSPWWQDANQPQKWGFAANQVTPFTIQTPDEERLYVWHVLPLPVYNRHETRLLAQAPGFCNDITTSESFRLLKEDPDARVLIFFHGNAGHLPNSIRAPMFHTLTAGSNYHLLSIDYRGFGKSTGFPTEDGLITDASALIDFTIHTAGVSPDRIVLLGQSLGTAVVAAVTERFAQKGVDFAGVVLVAGFSSLPTMLAGYSIAGWIPVLRPLAVWPAALRWFMSLVADTWKTADRVALTTRVVKARAGHLRLSLVHAADDWDIPCHEDDKIFAAAISGLHGDLDPQQLAEMKDARTVGRGKNAFVTQWVDGGITVKQELFPYGGHNDIMKHAPVASAVMRSFGDALDEESPAL